MTAMNIRGNSFKLRHNWEMEKLKDGVGEGEVARWWGVQDDGEIMKRYGEALISRIAKLWRYLGDFKFILRCILC